MFEIYECICTYAQQAVVTALHTSESNENENKHVYIECHHAACFNIKINMVYLSVTIKEKLFHSGCLAQQLSSNLSQPYPHWRP